MMIQKQPSIYRKLLLAILVITGWFALIAQFYLSINSGLAAPHIVFLRYFDYFTVTTNILVAYASTLSLISSTNGKPTFFTKQKTVAAIAMYITVVGVIFNLILRSLWNTMGLQMVVNELLHVVTPVLFFLYWLIFTAKYRLTWRSVWPWLIYPLVYTIYVFIFGAITDFYPYPFIDLKKLGLQSTAINVVSITLAFLVVSYLFVGIGKLGKKARLKVDRPLSV